MKKLILTLLLSTLVTLTCACGSNKKDFDEAEDIGVITNKKTETTVESVIPEEPEEEEEVEEVVEKTVRDYTGLYVLYPDDMSEMSREVNITSQDGDMITFDYNFYNMRTANGTETLTEKVVDDVVTFSASIFGGHGADGQASNLQIEFGDEDTMILRNRDSGDEWTLTKKSESGESADAEAPANPADEYYPSGYAPSQSGELSSGDIIGEYTSESGNVYSVNFYTSWEDERIGVIHVNLNAADESMKEHNEFVAYDTNVYFVYQTQNAFVFDYDGNYKLSYYKDGKLWDTAVMTRHYQAP